MTGSQRPDETLPDESRRGGAGKSVTSMAQVHLRDIKDDAITPVVRPAALAATAMPDRSRLAGIA